MKTLNILLTAGLTALSAQALTWIPYNGHEYALTSGALSPQAAEAEGVANGGHLVAINDQAEQNFLIGQWGNSGPLWIGFTDVAVEGTFVWTNGDPVTYTNWAPGEPNNLGNEDWTVMNWASGGRWNDLGSGALNYGILERVIPRPPGTVPDGGSTLALLAAGFAGVALVRRKL